MSAARFPRAAAPLHAEPPARRLLAAYLLSLLLHGVLLLSVTGGWRSTPPRDVQPVYYVDLVHKPVLNPQAGRPEPRLNQPPAPPAPVTSLPEKVVPPGKASPATRAPVKSSDRQVAAAVQKLRDERDRQAAIERLRQSQAVPADLPVGLPDAKGNEAGVPSEDYVKTTIQNNWALSPYTLVNPFKTATIEAWVRITYGKSGRLESFRFEKESGDPQFDESIKRALLKSQQLDQALPKRLEDILVKFNLKEMKALAEVRR